MLEQSKGKKMINTKGLKLASFVAISCAAVMLSGCSHKKQNLKEPNVMLHTIDLQIDAAAQSAATSLDQLASISKTQHPAAVKMPFKNISSPELSEYLSIKWYGPIKPILRNISDTIGYKLQVYGKEPSVPVLVNINTTGNVETAKQILTNIDLQANTSARVSIYPQQRLITMRYFDHAPTV
jgi:defect in organelle trafficking protein DotD